MPNGILEKFEELTGAPPLSTFIKENPEKLRLLQGIIHEIRLLMAEASKGGFKPELAHDAFSLLRAALKSSPEQLQAVMGLIKEMKELVKVAGKTGIAPEKILTQLREK